MIKNIIARRYSIALINAFKIAELKKLENEVDNFIRFLQDNVEIEEFLISPIAENKFKREIISKLVEGLKICEKFNNLLIILIDKDRIYYLKDICQDIISRIHQRLDIYDFELLTAHTIDSETIKKIKKFVSRYVSGEIRLKHSIDKRIKGGFLVYNKNLAINGSIENSLSNFKRKF